MPQNIAGANGPFANVSNSGGQWVATINWTDPTGTTTVGQPATGTVLFGTDPNNLSSNVDDGGKNYSDNPPTTHSLQLSGLTASTTYYYAVVTLDVNGNNVAQSATSSFVTAPQQVVGIPQAATSSPTAATITWQANCAGMGQVLLGPNPNSMTTPFADGVNAFSHSIQANPLQPGTQYYYVVNNLDGQGNVLAQSVPATFSTPPANVQVTLTQPKANPWIVNHGRPTTLSVVAVDGKGKPVAGITVNFKVLWHLGGNGNFVGANSAVTDATGTASVQFLSSSGELATVEATSPNSNSHLLVPVVIL